MVEIDDETFRRLTGAKQKETRGPFKPENKLSDLDRAIVGRSVRVEMMLSSRDDVVRFCKELRDELSTVIDLANESSLKERTFLLEAGSILRQFAGKWSVRKKQPPPE